MGVNLLFEIMNKNKNNKLKKNKEQADYYELLKLDLEKIVESERKDREKMIFENNSYTHWFRELIIDKDLLGYFENKLPEFTDYLYKNKRRNCIQYESNEDIQYLYVDYIAPISPDDVDFKHRSHPRMERISKWANHYSLNKIYYYNHKNKKILLIDNLPELNREYDLDKNAIKYTFSNGIHRFAFAKNNNIPTVLSVVQDKYIIRKSWIEKIIRKLEKEKGKYRKRNGIRFGK